MNQSFESILSPAVGLVSVSNLMMCTAALLRRSAITGSGRSVPALAGKLPFLWRTDFDGSDG
jgi:hypothetical protein